MTRRYSSVAIGFHWAIAVLLTGNIFLGWNMESADGRPVEDLFQLHKSIGITVLLLSVARLGWRLLNPPPPLPPDMNALEKVASHSVHLAFYGLMIGIPLAGWALVSVSEFDVSTVLYGVVSWPHLPVLKDLSEQTKSMIHGPVEFFHSKGAWLVLGLLGLHIAGAVKHQLSAEDGVLKRMVPFLFGKTAAPERPKGALLVFGGSIALFLVIAGVPALTTVSSTPANSDIRSAEVTPNWNINYDESFIRFSGTHDGNAFSGQFGDWSANISFNDSQPGTGQAVVTVATGSVETPRKLYTDTLKNTEWFATSAFPKAVVEVTNFRQTGNGYLAQALITIKESSLSTDLTFELSKDETGRTVMNGRTSLDRRDLNLGLKSDPNGDWVGLTIDVEVRVVATSKP